MWQQEWWWWGLFRDAHVFWITDLFENQRKAKECPTEKVQKYTNITQNSRGFPGFWRVSDSGGKESTILINSLVVEGW
jgi:hypothetical protein